MALAELATPSLVYCAGGKAKHRGALVELLVTVPHERYVEPFCGAAWVLLAKPRVPGEWLNDADGELINCFRHLADPEERAEVERRLMFLALHSRQLFDDYAAMSDPEVEYLSPVERAVRFLVYNRVGGGRGEWTERPSDAAPARWPEVLADAQGMARRLRAVHIEHGDGVDLLERLPQAGTLAYIDPPYLDERPGRPTADPALHHRLIAALAAYQGRFLVTHPLNDHWVGMAAMHDWQRLELGREYQLDGTWRSLWMFANFDLAGPVQQTLFS